MLDTSDFPADFDVRQKFVDLVNTARPELHRYCSGLLGSVTDGEDVVQDAVASALEALPEAEGVVNLRSWLFRIAHNRAIDVLRRRSRVVFAPIEEAADVPDDGDTADETISRQQTLAFALSRFEALPPTQRAAILLKDVLGHSLEDIGDLFGVTANAVKALLQRGRITLANLDRTAVPGEIADFSEETRTFARLFNGREFDELRRLLAEDVRLDQISKGRRIGRNDVGVFFTNYEKERDWLVVPAWLEGREALVMLDLSRGSSVRSFMLVSWEEGRIASIKDYRHVPYVAEHAVFLFRDAQA